MFIKQLSIFIENRKGRLAEITSLIAGAGINIRTLSIADTTSFGILRIIVDEPEEVEKRLRAEGLTVSVTTVLGLAVPDKPGGLAGALKLLADRGIDVEYMYGFVSKSGDDAFMILRVGDEFSAERILTEAGYKGIE